MKLWVVGAAGALGREVAAAAKHRQHEVRETTQAECPVEDMVAIRSIVMWFEPDCIINCAGILPGGNPVDSILANSLGPANLAATEIRLVHMSTDCVFAGDGPIWLKPTDRPDPLDVYGRTKLAGEIQADHALNVRGSFLSPHGGLLRWLLDSSGPVDAWENAYWNGSSAAVMAKALVTLAEGDANGVLHVASPQYVTKAELLAFFVDRLDLPVQLNRVQTPMIRRVLEPDYLLPNIWRCMEELAECVRR